MTEKNKQANVVKFLIPLVAVVVILESILLVTNLTRQTKVGEPAETSPEVSVMPVENVDFDVAVAGGADLRVGDEYPVEVTAVSRGEKKLDAVNLYVKYDSSAFDVSGLVFNDRLPKPTFSKVSKQKNLIVVNYLISDSSGFTVGSGESLSLLKFNVKPLKAGEFSFEVSTSKDSKESATMFVENATSKALPFSAGSLVVRVLD